jgi:hypothetical protein
MRYEIYKGVIVRAKTKIGIGIVGLMSLAFPVAMIFSNGAASAASSYSLTPWTFVGSAADCTPFPAGTPGGVVSKIDSTTGNPLPSLRLEKNVATEDCSAAGATINGVSGKTLTELNFDYATGTYCGAGAPRFNVTATDGFHFMGGCANATQTDLNNGWTHVVIDPSNPAQSFPVLTPGATITNIDIVFDEHGVTNIDNVSVNGQIVNQVTPVTKDDCKNNGWKSLVDANGNTFKNQGDCVSYVATKGKNPGAGPATPVVFENHLATGNVVLSGPIQNLSFITHDNGNTSSLDQGTVTYSNPDAGLTYTAATTCVNISGNTAYFAYVIPAGHNPYSGTW